MPLAADAVELVFGKLSLTYGHRFLSIWDGMPLEAVKADWAEVLDGVRHDRILWALQNLPERAPDAPAFRALCARMPEPGAPPRLLQGPRGPAPEFVRRVAEALHHKPASSEPQRIVNARAFIARHTAPGAHPTPYEREALERFRTILARYEAGTDLAERKADAQARAEAHPDFRPEGDAQ